jgi:hypothetical protein
MDGSGRFRRPIRRALPTVVVTVPVRRQVSHIRSEAGIRSLAPARHGTYVRCAH